MDSASSPQVQRLARFDLRGTLALENRGGAVSIRTFKQGQPGTTH
jgi:hypothetical protein